MAEADALRRTRARRKRSKAQAMPLLIASVALCAYTEIVPTRHPWSGAAVAVAPASWPRFPAADASHAVATSAGAAVVSPGPDGTLMVWLGASAASGFERVELRRPVTWDREARLVVSDGDIVGLAAATGYTRLRCALAHLRCDVDARAPSAFGAVHATATAPDGSVWLATAGGLYVLRPHGGVAAPVQVLGGAMTSVAARGQLVGAGNADKVWVIDGATARVVRWEWVTEVEDKSGGVVDAPVTAMAFADDADDLFIGNARALNVRAADGTFARVGAGAGLPYANITALLPRTRTDGARELWIGTAKGVALWTPSAPHAWRYMHGPRWMAGEAVRSLVAAGDAVLAVTDGGATWLEQRETSLAEKAEMYGAMLTARHQRHGLAASCATHAFGDPAAGCLCRDDDNDGLWTAMALAAAYFRHAVTGEPAALAMASSLLGGITTLHRVTGVRGLPARSVCSPDEIAAWRCGIDTWIHDRTRWVNATAAGFDGWTWKTDTSSDEVTGHLFGLTIAARLSPLPPERELAATLLLDTVSRIVANGYVLIDVTGKPTTWGKWAPRYVNGDRDFSDGRGLQSLQMLALLAGAVNASAAAGADVAPLWAAYAELTNGTNQYLQNALNQKITDPLDINYSDDELAFLPFYVALTACPPGSACAAGGFDARAVRAALDRSWRFVSPERSALWSAIRLAAARVGPPARRQARQRREPPADSDATRDAMKRSLITWPRELIDWPVENSHRIDIMYEPGVDRFGKAHVESTHSRPPLPANERRQYRWNSDPYNVADGGDGMSEADPGAWLLPYWMARYHELLSADD